jgi:hypothetical protein
LITKTQLTKILKDSGIKRLSGRLEDVERCKKVLMEKGFYDHFPDPQFYAGVIDDYVWGF